MKLKSATFLMDGDPGTGGGGGGTLLNPGAGGGTPDWRATLPEDIRSDAAFSTVKAKDAGEALGIIGKMYVGAQKLIGVDKIPRPSEKWTAEQWREHHKIMGVPETHDKYALPDIKLAKGLEIKAEKLDAFKKIFHAEGLTPRQVSAVMKAYLEDVNNDYTTKETSHRTAMSEATTELQGRWKDKYDGNLDVARSVIKKFGGDTLVAKFEATGLANDPEVAEFLYKIGQGLMEDGAGGAGGDLLLQDHTQALQEINKLKGDADFQKQLNTRSDPGHKAAVDRWLLLHQTAASRKD